VEKESYSPCFKSDVVCDDLHFLRHSDGLIQEFLFVFKVLKGDEEVIEKVNLKEKFGLFSELWSPKIVGEVNDAHVKIGKLKGEFIWHRHEAEDEMFFIVKGKLTIRVRDPEERDISLTEGEFVTIPRGIEHMPVSENESWIMMIEPKGTLNTGDITDNRTVEEPEWI